MIEKNDVNVNGKIANDIEASKINERENFISAIQENDIPSLLNKRSKVMISVNSLSLPNEDTRRIEKQIEDMIETEIKKYEDSQLEAVKSKEDNRINVSLKGLSLPNEDTRRLEKQIEDMIETEIKKNEETIRTGEPIDPDDPNPRPRPPTCVCGTTYIPGTRMYLPDLPPKSPVVWAMCRGIEDAIRVTIENGAPYGLQPNTMMIVLESEPNITWGKEISGWNLCRENIITLRTRDNVHGPSSMILYKGCGGADTLVFRKQKFAGIWTDMYNFDYREFWNRFGGKKLTFTWVADDRGC